MNTFLFSNSRYRGNSCRDSPRGLGLKTLHKATSKEVLCQIQQNAGREVTHGQPTITEAPLGAVYKKLYMSAGSMVGAGATQKSLAASPCTDHRYPAVSSSGISDRELFRIGMLGYQRNRMGIEIRPAIYQGPAGRTLA